jgi:hypothetical protein
VNLIYFLLTQNMNQAQKARFDLELAPPELKEKTIDEQNAEAMKLLTGNKPMAKPVPLPHKRRKT